VRQPSFTGERGANSRGQSRPGVFQLLRFPDIGDRLIGVKVRLALVPCGLASGEDHRAAQALREASLPICPVIAVRKILRLPSRKISAEQIGGALGAVALLQAIGRAWGRSWPDATIQLISTKHIAFSDQIRSTSSSVMTSAIRPSFVVRGHLLNSHLGCHSQCHGPQCRVTAVIFHTSA
jgi:hypothetical protein